MRNSLFALALLLTACPGKPTTADTEPDRRLSELTLVDAQVFCLELSERIESALTEDEWQNLYCIAKGTWAGYESTDGPQPPTQEVMNARCTAARNACESEPGTVPPPGSLHDCGDDVVDDDVTECGARLADIQHCVDALVEPLRADTQSASGCSFPNITSHDYREVSSPECKILLDSDGCEDFLKAVVRAKTE